MKRAILVVGPPRSGTSVVAHVLNRLGVDFGDPSRFIDTEKHKHNPIFFELQELNAINDEIFLRFGKKWVDFDWLPLSSDFSESLISLLEIEIKKFLNNEFGNSKIIGLKDPRFCFTLPVWLQVLERCGYEISVVYTKRNPYAVFCSNKDVNKEYIKQKNFKITLESILVSSYFLKEKSFVGVDYGKLVGHPGGETRLLCQALGLDLTLVQYASAVILPQLNHSCSCPREDLSNYFECLASSNADPAIEYEKYREVASVFVAERQELLTRLSRTVAERDSRIADLERAASERDSRIADLGRAASERDSRIADLDRAVAERDSRIADLDRAVTERDSRIAGLDRAVSESEEQIAGLKKVVGEREGELFRLRGEIEKIYNSRSWRLTEPLRLLSIQLRKRFRSIFTLLRITRALRRGDKARVGQTLTLWWCKQNNDYEYLKIRHPLWAKLRYGVFRKLAGGTIKEYIKKQFGIGEQGSGTIGQNESSIDSDIEQSPSVGAPPPYNLEYQPDEDFTGLISDIKAIAFYLPQFHVTEENDEWWGAGFTEWTNTRQAIPRFPGHYQPREPHDDIGYYDLSDIEVMRRQVALARKHGIYGFCFYHYWFSGQRLLEKPVDLLLRHPEINIHFCLCWANENWTRTWDGLHQDVLIEQKDRPGDAINFISDLRPYLEDPRYLRVGGKPVIMVYKPQIIPEVEEVFSQWRQWWRDNQGGELAIWCNRTDFQDTGCKALSGFIDAVVEFPPHVVLYGIDQAKLGFDTNGHFFDYRNLVSDIIRGTERTETPPLDFYRSAMLGWDNSARRKEGWSVWYGFSRDSYYDWLRHIISYTRQSFPEDRRFVFINAWNEWAEGTYLEPDRKYGYANLNTTSRALFDLPVRALPRILPARSRTPPPAAPGSIGVHIHLFYEEVARELLGYVNHIPYPFDLFITTDTEEKVAKFRQLFESDGCQERLVVIKSPNIGRDIGPFLVTVGKLLADYDYVGHFHGKKSTTVNWGDRWRRFLLDNLLGSSEGILGIFEEFAGDPRLGLLYPPPYPLIAPYLDWGGGEVRCRLLLRELGYDPNLPPVPNFPAGNMFWARGEAIKPMLGRSWKFEQFEPEEGQLMLTLPHAVERLWPYLVAGGGYYSEEILLMRHTAPEFLPEKRRLALFAHYEPGRFVSEADLFYLRELKMIASDIVVISNSDLSPVQCRNLRNYARDIICRPNVGFDFAAWRDALLKIGWDNLASYDELILANNSCYGPIFALSEMFSEMAPKSFDFWSVSGFPALENSSRAEAELLPDRNIPAHLQSYFMVFGKSVVNSQKFKQFWGMVEDKRDLLEVVASYETRLTGELAAVGFSWGCYLPESYTLQERNASVAEYNAIYSQPLDMLLLRIPLLKKKIAAYAPELIPLLRKMVADLEYFPAELLFAEPPEAAIREIQTN